MRMWLQRSAGAALTVALALIVSSPAVVAEDHCTAMLVGAKASTTGAPMTSHTNDCSNCDFRIGKVPEMTYESNAMRDLVLVRLGYPRYVGEQRGQVYRKENLDTRFHEWPETSAIGQIPEVNHTFAYIDGIYGIFNEHGLSIGESTCSGRLVSRPATQGGHALLDVSELSRIAQQRCKTARCAVQLMGDLAVRYGYYGADWEGDSAYEEAGEALTVTDAQEAWMFHILPDDTGKSAVWVAQRVPDDHFCAIANQFVIHQIDLSDADYFLASENIFEVAQRNGFWRSEKLDGPFDFTRVYSMPRASGHQIYSTRRVWRLFTLVDPALNLPSETDEYGSDYPFSIKVPQELSPQDIMRFQRDHYEGTQFDMTQGPDAGPYGNPDRYDPAPNGDLSQDDVDAGHFERAISIFRTVYSFVTVPNPKNSKLGYVWYGQYAPHATTYTPIYAHVTSIPQPYSSGSLFAYDSSVSFWVHALVGNWASHFYKYAHPFVERVQLQTEERFASFQPIVMAKAQQLLENNGIGAMRAFLTKQCAEFADDEVQAFGQLFEYLVTVFHDGYQMTDFFTADLRPIKLFYPKWWLQQVGFFSSTKTHSYLRPVTQKYSQLHAHAPWTLQVGAGQFLSLGFMLVVGVIIGRFSRRGVMYNRLQ